MPTSLINAYAKEYHKTVNKIEDLWNKAKAIISKEYPKAKDSKYYALVVGTLKKMLGESISIKLKYYHNKI